MTQPHNHSIARINDLWGIHHPSETAPEGLPHCLAFAVDGRYVEQDGIRYRLGASFGGNPFTPADAVGFAPPPVRPGKFVLGMHVVGTEGDKLTIYDEWYDAREVGPDAVDSASGLEAARAWLRSVPDGDYARRACPDPGAGALGREPERPVGGFEVIEDAATSADRASAISAMLDLL